MKVQVFIQQIILMSTFHMKAFGNIENIDVIL
jgi:hypothetical protein